MIARHRELSAIESAGSRACCWSARCGRCVSATRGAGRLRRRADAALCLDGRRPKSVLSYGLDHGYGYSGGSWRSRPAAWRWRAPLLVAFLAAFVLNISADRAARQRRLERTRARRRSSRWRRVCPRRARHRRIVSVSGAARPAALSASPSSISEAGDNTDTPLGSGRQLQPDWIVTMRDESAFTPPFGILSVDVPHMHLQIPDAALAQAYHLADRIATSVGNFEIWRRFDAVIVCTYLDLRISTFFGRRIARVGRQSADRTNRRIKSLAWCADQRDRLPVFSERCRRRSDGAGGRSGAASRWWTFA